MNNSNNTPGESETCFLSHYSVFLHGMEGKERILFHGSDVVVETPRISVSGFNKDFGFGFYCTLLEKQAVRWALAKHNRHVVNSYSFVPGNDLCVLSFLEMTDEWLDFVTDCRRGIPHGYDIVEGPMADDTVWDYVEDYVAGKISREAFWALAKFKYPTHQVVFCTEKALESLSFKDFKDYDK